MKRASGSGTRRRLLRAATELFAERGFHGTKIRDIADRAGVNLASGNYHFGSKRDLYLEVLRTQFAAIRNLFSRRSVQPTATELAKLPRASLERLLEKRVQSMLDVLVGPPLGAHGALMLREMADPSEALPVIVREFIFPMKSEMEAIVSRLAPELSARDIERCGFSIVGQVLHYRFAMPIVLELLGLRQYPSSFSRHTARHIARFSVGGMGRARNGGGGAR